MSVGATEILGDGPPGWSAPPALFLLLSLAIALSFWIVPAVVAPDKSPDGLVLFREAGDPSYLPPVASLAHLKFGEPSVKEYAGTGVQSFPFVPFIVHAIFYRIAGSIGFILADLLTVILYGCLLRQFLLVAGVAQAPAGLLSLVVISGAAAWVNTKTLAVFHHALPVLFWEFRFPRPSVTQSVFILFLILATTLTSRRGQTSTWLFALFGVAFAAVLQSDLYSAFDAAFVLGAVSIIVVARSRDRWAAARRLCATALAIGIAGAPFIYQQAHTSPDVKRRFGVFSTQRYSALLPAANIMVCTFLLIVAALVLAVLFRRGLSKRHRIAALTVAAVAAGASVISGPVSLAVLQQTIQIFHFQFQAMLAIGYVLLLYAGWLLTDVKDVSPFRGLSEKRWFMLSAAASVVVVGFCLFIAYRSSVRRNGADVPTDNPMRDNLNLVHYRTDFRELHQVLDGPEYADAGVLGTFDRQLSLWWLYRRRYLYLVDLIDSPLPDSLVDSRVCQFLRLVGASTEEFSRLLDNSYFLVQVMGMERYQAESLFTAWPLSDYSAAARRRIASTSWDWHLELPESERSRLLMEYDQTGQAQQQATALDIVVFDKDVLRPYVHPERDRRFRLAWSNRTFELWVPNKP